jgi:hypothetical protein
LERTPDLEKDKQHLLTYIYVWRAIKHALVRREELSEYNQMYLLAVASKQNSTNNRKMTILNRKKNNTEHRCCRDFHVYTLEGTHI